METMTKYEYAVIHLMAGMLSNPALTDDYPVNEIRVMAHEIAHEIVGAPVATQ